MVSIILVSTLGIAAVDVMGEKIADFHGNGEQDIQDWINIHVADGYGRQMVDDILRQTASMTSADSQSFTLAAIGKVMNAVTRIDAKTNWIVGKLRSNEWHDWYYYFGTWHTSSYQCEVDYSNEDWRFEHCR